MLIFWLLLTDVACLARSLGRRLQLWGVQGKRKGMGVNKELLTVPYLA